jgi:hypothetical protein
MLMRAGFAFAVLSCAAFDAQAACEARSGANVVPLVELYTSEGCSSCPPADRWLSKLALADAGEANFLAFHVDYWDEIGWHDRFGSPAYSQRQRQRVAAAEGGDTVYTPQVMVGSNVRVAWSDPRKFSAALRSGPARASLALRLDPTPVGRRRRWRNGMSASPRQAFDYGWRNTSTGKRPKCGRARTRARRCTTIMQ